MENQLENASKIQLWPEAKTLLTDTTFVDHVLSAGVGYGKTHFESIWLYWRIVENAKDPNHKGLLYAVIAPTYKLLKAVNLQFFIDFLRQVGLIEKIHFKVNLSEMTVTFLTTGDKVFFVSADNYKTIVAYTLACIVQDEPGWQPDEVRIELRKRLRANCKIRQFLRVGVPQGAGDSIYFSDCTGPEFESLGIYVVEDKQLGEQTYTRFRYKEGRLIMHASTHENPLLPDDYIDNMYEDYGFNKNLWLQQVHGQFVPSSSNSLFEFSESEHCHVHNVPHFKDCGTLWLSWDFNVGQVTWLLYGELEGRYYNINENGSNARDTIQACEQFVKANQGFKSNPILITGDSSGHSRDTRSLTSDYKIIEKYLRENGFHVKVVAPRSNPDISYSIVACNKLFDNGRMLISKRSTKLIYSLNRTEPNERGGVKKPSGETWTHPSDAHRYFVWLVEPVRYGSAKALNMAA